MEGQPEESKVERVLSAEEKAFRRTVYNHIAKYAKADDTIAWFNLITTYILVFACFYLHKWYLLPLAVMLRMRFFVLFHDIAHMNYFSSPTVNRVVGLLTSVLTFGSYSDWRDGHNLHHYIANNMDKPLWAQTAPLSVQQFRKADWKMKLFYVFTYGHYTLFTINPYLYFVVKNRFIAKWYENLIVFTYWGIMYGIVAESWTQVLYDQVCIFFAALFGFLLFHIQHTFEDTFREYDEKWDFFEAGMKGSSFLQVPWFLKYFLNGIEYHHIHHLNAKVPSYKIRQCHEDGAKLFENVPKLYMNAFIENFSYSIYDEESKKFVSVYSILGDSENKKK